MDRTDNRSETSFLPLTRMSTTAPFQSLRVIWRLAVTMVSKPISEALTRIVRRSPLPSAYVIRSLPSESRWMSRRMTGVRARTATKYSATTRAAMVIIPNPHAIPTAAATQIALAVVRPRTLSCSKKITPAPMKPIPETTCAAIRDASQRILPVSADGAPYSDTRVNR